MRKPPKLNEKDVPIPPLQGDSLHKMTILPYLEEHYYDFSNTEGDDGSAHYITERELNGEFYITRPHTLPYIYLELKYNATIQIENHICFSIKYLKT